MKSNKQDAIAISVVIPSYNAASWLPKTVPKVSQALQTAGVKKAEIIIVDDGSTDGTAVAAEKLKLQYPIKVIKQKNGGRFVARQNGTEQASYEYILFIDTRIYIAPRGLAFIIDTLAREPERRVWTSHVYLDKTANIYARFWDALTSVAWRRYFSNPRDYSYGLKEFDYYPKGTTCFFVPKKIIQEANNWFVANTKNLKTSNDDTLLIRHIAAQTNININPKFSCTYHARTSFKQYTRHVYHRGKVFVDGFLRRDGNRFFWPLVLFLILSMVVPVTLVFVPSLIWPLLALVILLWVFELFACLLSGVSWYDAWSLMLLSPVFAVYYGLGIWAAFLKIFVLKNGPQRS